MRSSRSVSHTRRKLLWTDSCNLTTYLIYQSRQSTGPPQCRTFVVFRHWINNHFEDDFLTSKSLRFQMALFLNEMRFNHKVQTSARDSRIIRNLMDFFKQQRRHYKALAEEGFAAEQAEKSRPGSSTRGVSSPGGSRSDEGVYPFQQSHGQSSKAAVDRPDASKAWRETESSSPVMKTTSDISDSIPSSLPPKARLRAATLAGGPLGISVPIDDGTQSVSIANCIDLEK